MARQLLVGLVAVGLGIGVWALWPRSNVPATTTTSLPLGSHTTRPGDPTTSTSLQGTTTTSLIESHVVQTVEEAEAILRELWFGWFEGIYNQDEERIREVVATEEQVEDAVGGFGATFTRAPFSDGVLFDATEILRSDEECLVAWGIVDISSFRGSGAVTQTVTVLRWQEGEWRFMSNWTHRNDLWETDCDARLGSR